MNKGMNGKYRTRFFSENSRIITVHTRWPRLHIIVASIFRRIFSNSQTNCSSTNRLFHVEKFYSVGYTYNNTLVLIKFWWKLPIISFFIGIYWDFTIWLETPTADQARNRSILIFLFLTILWVITNWNTIKIFNFRKLI